MGRIRRWAASPGRARRALPPTVAVRPAPVEPTDIDLALDPDQGVPSGVRVAAAWTWRLLLLGLGVVGLFFVLRHFSAVTVPLAVAVLLTALLIPLADRLERWHVPRALAAALSMLAMVVVLAGSFTLIGTQVAAQAPDLWTRALEGFESLLNWLGRPPLNLSDEQLAQYYQQARDLLTRSQSSIASSVADLGAGVGDFLAGLAIALFSTFFFLYQGRGIWTSLLGLVPDRARFATDLAARKGWASLVVYVRATIVVALFDAVLITIGALIIGVPLAIAIGALVFFGAFIPLLGAAVSGMAAVLVALVSINWFWALIMLAIIVVVMQIEGHILQPLLLGKAVEVHPLAVLLGIAVGVIVSGIVGALFAVPIIAFGNAFIHSLRDPEIVPADPHEDEGEAAPE